MKRVNEKKRRERLEVIDNIKRALEDGDSFRKVEIGDPMPSEREIKRKIVPFDNLRKKSINRLKRAVARAIANKATFMLNSETEIVGLENLAEAKDGAIITSNHFNPMDCTLTWLMAMCAGREKELSIVVQQSNIFMKGFFGFLMRNCNTMPVSSNLSYMARNLKPALKERLEGGELVLIYPEQEMWFNYKKPREFRIGAYQYAAEFGVPVIPCFAEMRECDELDDCGFYKIKYVFHVMKPIYPDESLPFRERRDRMHALDVAAKRECYERVYGIPLDDEFIPERDIAGYKK
ncbi:MAG: 1-acyl-sn-glycerol-3-phosphate acyltransferase [Clostridia bacterium]|nr:1-acyl-sn-glycerol-3-phosphate acyltransferase [Clostridia bacterium]